MVLKGMIDRLIEINVEDIMVRYVLPTQCIYVVCVDLRTNSDYFTVQH
jgi:hypothetical protein